MSVGKTGNAEADEERTGGVEQGDKPGLEIGTAGVEGHLRCSLAHSTIVNHELRACGLLVFRYHCMRETAYLVHPSRDMNKPIASKRKENHQSKKPIASLDLSDPKMKIQ